MAARAIVAETSMITNPRMPTIVCREIAPAIRMPMPAKKQTPARIARRRAARRRLVPRRVDASLGSS